MASEVFTCEIDVILRTLVEEEEVGLLQFLYSIWSYLLWEVFDVLTSVACQMMDLLFSFLEPNRPHSALLAGYFSKVCDNFSYELADVFLCAVV